MLDETNDWNNQPNSSRAVHEIDIFDLVHNYLCTTSYAHACLLIFVFETRKKTCIWLKTCFDCRKLKMPLKPCLWLYWIEFPLGSRYSPLWLHLADIRSHIECDSVTDCMVKSLPLASVMNTVACMNLYIANSSVIWQDRVSDILEQNMPPPTIQYLAVHSAMRVSAN